MTILLHKPYLVKVTTNGGGGSKIPKILITWFMDDPIHKIVQFWPNVHFPKEFPDAIINPKNQENT